MTAETCLVHEGERRILHGYDATILGGCEPSQENPDWCRHRVRFDTLINRTTGTWHETSAFGWEFGRVIEAAAR
ncbi:hypothetical protein Drose_05790 [Dactylosporangium roseum]|uniref:Uncharacterized protein n=1 Tax=Dactylosporangium roseum TaxID=47989 RepID=A0ABY5ZAF7_9ACTN|nr:hypothetical protein [Dactylosporangium roseum]UWZ37782.1 hypothetical protein Drose_05790 [Dactylosporangium roseum]